MPRKPTEQTSPFEQGVAALAYNMRVAPKVSGISKSKLYQLAAGGKLKLTRVGGRTLVEHAELLRLVNEGYANDKTVTSAIDWLRQLLAKGPVAAEAVKRNAKASRHSWPTVRRAHKQLGIKTRQRDGSSSPFWELP